MSDSFASLFKNVSSSQKEDSTSSSPTPTIRLQDDENKNNEFPPLPKRSIPLSERISNLSRSSLTEREMADSSVPLSKNVLSSQKKDSTSSSSTPSMRLQVQGDENKKNLFSPLPKHSIPSSAGSSSRSKISLTEPKMKNGEATLKYEISDSGGDVCHGFLDGACVSFIRFDNSEKAQRSKSLLQGLRSGKFVYFLMVIGDSEAWQVTEKIDSTLIEFKEENPTIWSCYQLDEKYRIIVRDIIAVFNQSVNQSYTGELKIQDFAIINGCAKLMRLSNEHELEVKKPRDQLQELLEGLLGRDHENEELIDFYSRMKRMPMCNFIHLRNHPILLTSQERLQFPVLLLQLLNYGKKSSDWKARYDTQYGDEEGQKVKRLQRAISLQKDKKIFYSNTASSQIFLSRNFLIHINEDGKCRIGEEVGKKLKDFFPDLWTRLFSLMICEGIDIWDQCNEKYGGDLLSHWRATLKLCILENNDLATEHFLKICGSFLSLTEMKADKSGAISSLVTTIKKQIYTVESNFLQDQFKYRKLEGIFKDDNVCSTSTKLAENSCTNCINFLMRFLKFIALFLRNYALNPDGEVKRMFETAYSSLLNDDPDSKKKRKDESLKKKTLQNLLESAPSNEEFKSLLGNPKNMKDRGMRVAESLTILTDRWDKLSVSPTLL
ncbi:hypothetical protein CMV_014418 [Castanea mollissima]|uniref:Glycolipid transfer protein domain-containing protein n=1 Tax=Castanea mollissima TaxID=60419 RepID=A0A8J4QXR2_9ROSI|nr:hypothetical protein CMV_014418 [Castanea mollissima]